MANITISNNGNEDEAEILEDLENGVVYRAARKASVSYKITCDDGHVVIIKPLTSVGIPECNFKVEVIL